jgi:hypothetical protein
MQVVMQESVLQVGRTLFAIPQCLDSTSIGHRVCLLAVREILHWWGRLCVRERQEACSWCKGARTGKERFELADARAIERCVRWMCLLFVSIAKK